MFGIIAQKLKNIDLPSFEALESELSLIEIQSQALLVTEMTHTSDFKNLLRKKKLIQLLSPNRTKNPTFLHQLSPPLVYIPGSWRSSLIYASTSPSQSKLANQMGDTFRRVGKPMRLRDVLVTGGQNIWRITPPSAWPR